LPSRLLVKIVIVPREGGELFYRAMLRKPVQPLRKRPDATAQPLPPGAAVRLRGRDATGVVIGNSHYEYRVRVQWDDTGEVTHCLKRNLEPAR
jgi:hypothetical protein